MTHEQSFLHAKGNENKNVYHLTTMECWFFTCALLRFCFIFLCEQEIDSMCLFQSAIGWTSSVSTRVSVQDRNYILTFSAPMESWQTVGQHRLARYLALCSDCHTLPVTWLGRDMNCYPLSLCFFCLYRIQDKTDKLQQTVSWSTIQHYTQQNNQYNKTND